MPNLINVSNEDLSKIAVDRHALSGTFADVVGDCCGADLKTRSDVVNRFPLVVWLLQTELSNTVRSMMFEAKRCGMSKVDGKWMVNIPGQIWSLPGESSAQECCFVPFQFDKCSTSVPLNLLCLKDCEDILDEMVQNRLRSATVDGLAYAGETEKAVRDRINRLSFAFYEAYNVIYGHDETFVETGVPLKPFHGLAQLMDNPAIVSIAGGDVYAAFKSVGCRKAFLGGTSVIWVNPIIYRSIAEQIQPNMYGRYPAGWTMVNGRLQYQGMRFEEDRLVPVDMENGVGEAWLLDGSAVGGFLFDQLFATEAYTRRIPSEASLADGCAVDCTYYYNAGTTFNNNASKLMKIVDIPISGACASGVADLTDIIIPNTLVPNIG